MPVLLLGLLGSVFFHFEHRLGDAFICSLHRWNLAYPQELLDKICDAFYLPAWCSPSDYVSLAKDLGLEVRHFQWHFYSCLEFNSWCKFDTILMIGCHCLSHCCWRGTNRWVKSIFSLGEPKVKFTVCIDANFFFWFLLGLGSADGSSFESYRISKVKIGQST